VRDKIGMRTTRWVRRLAFAIAKLRWDKSVAHRHSLSRNGTLLTVESGPRKRHAGWTYFYQFV